MYKSVCEAILINAIHGPIILFDSVHYKRSANQKGHFFIV